MTILLILISGILINPKSLSILKDAFSNCPLEILQLYAVPLVTSNDIANL